MEQLQHLGFADKQHAVTEPLVNPELRKDMYDGTQSLFAEWRTATGALLGYLLIHENGQLYAEFDVVAPHPSDKRWFIEAITVWGQGDQIKSEPRLLPAV